MKSFGAKIVAALLLTASLVSGFTPARLSAAKLTSAKASKMPELDLFQSEDLAPIFEGNKRWVEVMTKIDPDYFKNLGDGQTPSIMWIGCADSRVPPGRIMGLDAGEVFAVRNVANQVSHMDNSVMSALQFGINALKIPHIVVCGHYACGGVKASMTNVDHTPPLEQWVRNVRDVQRLNAEELRSIEDDNERFRRLVEINTVEQCINLFKTDTVQRMQVKTHDNKDYPFSLPRIHAVVFDPATGELKDLNPDFQKKLKELGDIYDMYSIEDAASL